MIYHHDASSEYKKSFSNAGSRSSVTCKRRFDLSEIPKIPVERQTSQLYQPKAQYNPSKETNAKITKLIEKLGGEVPDAKTKQLINKLMLKDLQKQKKE